MNDEGIAFINDNFIDIKVHIKEGTAVKYETSKYARTHQIELMGSLKASLMLEGELTGVSQQVKLRLSIPDYMAEEILRKFT